MIEQLSPVSWRPSRAEDIETVAALEAGIHPFPWTEGNFRDSLAAGHCCIVGEIRGVIVTYGVLLLGPGEAQILNVSTAPHQRRRGHAAELIEHLIEKSVEAGAEQVFLEVRVSNHVAIALYHKLGFHEIARRPGYYPLHGGREDALVMRLSLPRNALRARGR